jgi:hypothetical protein
MLTARQRLLASVIDAFGGADLQSFDDRLLLQKRVFLLGVAGVDLGYVHSWYVRGPYCPALTRDAFAFDRERGRTELSTCGMSLPNVVVERIAVLKEALGRYWRNSRELELLASVVFLHRTAKAKTATELIEALLKRKPKYKSHEVVNAIALAKQNGWLQ